jgi:hypothetical protein
VKILPQPNLSKFTLTSGQRFYRAVFLTYTSFILVLAYLLVFPPLPTPNVLADPANPLKPANPSLSLAISGLTSTNPNNQLSITDVAPNAPTKTASLTITTTTDNPTGYKTTLSTNHTTNTCLLRSTDTDCSTTTSKIGPVTGTVASPNKLNPNQWGVTLATTFTNSDKGDDSVWFQIPNQNSPVIINTTTTPTPATGDNQNLTFGTKVDYSLSAGNYSNTVIITATANSYSATPTISTITPDTGEPTDNTTITITGTNLGTAYQVFIDLNNNGTQDTNEQCTDANIDSSTQITCTTPTAAAGSYSVIVKTWGGTATKTDGFIYQSAIATTCKTTSASYDSFTIDLDANMLPITYTGNTTTPQWQIASNDNWCDYNQQQWANAVTVTSASLATYQAAATGTPIAESDILGYWTYIPRYKYQVQRFSPTDLPYCGPAATNNPGQVTGTCSTTHANGLYGPRNFNIEFQKSTDPVATPTQKGDWATHPAFTAWTSANGGAGLNGIWVGKFETTGTSTAPTIKPNQTSLKNQTVSLQYDQAKRIGAVDTTAESYGGASYLNGAGTATIPQNQHNLTTAKTHDFTNSDWGAVIYLATSTYGAGDQTFANGSTYLNDYGIVAKNANSAYVTGCGPDADHNDNDYYSGGTTCTPTSDNINRSYYTTLGQQASTTQNVYGVYDMSGGALEYTMANHNSTNGSASFNTMPTGAPYVNVYPSSTFNGNQYSNFQSCTFATCGGQGLYETTFVVSVSSYNQSWSRDNSGFVYSSNSWARRGGDYNGADSAGLFYSNSSSGGAGSSIGFRVALGAY